MTISALVALPAAGPGAAARRRRGVAVRAGGRAGRQPALADPVAAPAGVRRPGRGGAFAARADTPFGSLGSLLMLGGMWNAQVVPAGYGGGWSVLWLAAVLARAGRVPAAGAGWPAGPGSAWPRWPGWPSPVIGMTGPGQDAAAGRQPAVARVRRPPGRAAVRRPAGAGRGARCRPDRGVGPCRPGRCGPAARARPVPPATRRPPGVACRMRARPAPARPDWLGWLIAVTAGCSRRCCCCPGWPGARPGGCARPGTRPGWLAAARMINQSPAPGDGAAAAVGRLPPPGLERRPAVLDPWPRLVSPPGDLERRQPGSGGIQLRPDDPAGPPLDRRHPAAARPLSGPLAGGRRAVRGHRLGRPGPGPAARLPAAARHPADGPIRPGCLRAPGRAGRA